MAAILGVSGLVIGSFLGLASLRLPTGRDIVFGRSRCGGCGAPLTPQHMVPVVSYLCLGGRCGRCRSVIPARYPLIELAAAVVGAVAGATLSSPLAAGLAALSGWLGILSVVLLVEHRRAPHVLGAMLLLSIVATAVAARAT